MKKIIALLVLASAGLAGFAQPADAPAAQPDLLAAAPSMAVERTRIGAERARLTSGFAVEDAACYRKFMVNNCLDKVRLRREEVLADLRRQEISLNAQERKARGADQIRKTEEKASPEMQQEAAEKRTAAMNDFAARMARDKQKIADRATLESNEKTSSEASSNRAKANQGKAVERSSKQAGSAAEVRKFNERVEKAKERQARYDRDQAAQDKPAVKSLPTPE